MKSFTGWICTDCVFYHEYGNLPEHMSSEEQAAYVAEIRRRLKGTKSVTSGMLASEHIHESYARCSAVDWHEIQDSDGNWIPDGSDEDPEKNGNECDCERNNFSRSPCDMCGSHLGWAREAVTFRLIEQD